MSTCVCVSVWMCGREGREGQTIPLCNPHQCLSSKFPLIPLLPKGVLLTSCPKPRYTVANAPQQSLHMGALHTTATKGICHWNRPMRVSVMFCLTFYLA